MYNIDCIYQKKGHMIRTRRVDSDSEDITQIPLSFNEKYIFNK